MKPIALCGLLLLCVAHTGCSLCCTPWDYAYPTYGSLTPRDDQFEGRVGSMFHPAGPTPGVTRPYGYLPPPPPTDSSNQAEEPEESMPEEVDPEGSTL